MESSHQQAERRASEWLSRRDSGIWSENDQLALERWLDESPVNAVAFIRLESAWTRADRFKALGAGFPPHTAPTPEQLNRSPFFSEAAASPARLRPVAAQDVVEPRQSEAKVRLAALSSYRRPSIWSRFSIAASLLIAIALGTIWYVSGSGEIVSTPVGGTTSVPMEDGSRVTLNTDSQVEVNVTDVLRRVQLNRGEAFFEVRKDPQRPFVVDAGTARVVAVGTQFSVRREGEKVHVLVTEGRVRVQGVGTRPDESLAAGGSATFILAAGDVARADRAGVLVQSKPLVDVLEATNWRLGFVVFRNVTLAEAIAEFNRYNEKKIVVHNSALAALRLSGKFKATNVDAFVRLLEEAYPIEARGEPGGIVLTERQP